MKMVLEGGQRAAGACRDPGLPCAGGLGLLLACWAQGLAGMELLVWHAELPCHVLARKNLILWKMAQST